MTRVLIYGGTGLIGSHLTLRMLRDGHSVTCVDLREPAMSPLLDEIAGHPRFKFIRHDVVMPLHAECDRIFNLASPTYLHHDSSQPFDTMRTNVLGAIRTLELARENRARLLFASSGDIYQTRNGTCSTVIHRDESFYSTLCEAKRSAEALHRAYRRQYGVDARIARIFNTYGTGAPLDDGRAVMCMIVAALNNRDIVINGDGDQIRTFCWVGDTVEALAKFMEADLSPRLFALNIGGRYEISIRQLAATIIRLSGSKSRIVAGNPRRDDERRKVPDLQLTRRLIGWVPEVSISEGVMRTIHYVRRTIDHRTAARRTWVEVS